MLDKVISFDDVQQAVYTLQPPLIVIGSAGSGKTVITQIVLEQACISPNYATCKLPQE